MLWSMQGYNFFHDDKGHLRSGWRLGFFVVAFFICAQIIQTLLLAGFALVLHRPADLIAASDWNFAAAHGAMLVSAVLVGWGCGALFEELPFRALGCSFRSGWLKNLGLGSALGAASLLTATLLATTMRSVHFRLDSSGAGSIGGTLAISALAFAGAAAAEESSTAAPAYERSHRL